MHNRAFEGIDGLAVDGHRNFMSGIRLVVKNLIAAELLSPNGEEVSEREVLLNRRFDVNDARGVVGMNRMQAGCRCADVRGNRLLNAADDYFQLGMDMELRSRLGRTHQGDFPARCLAVRRKLRSSEGAHRPNQKADGSETAGKKPETESQFEFFVVHVF